jgi:two-component system LytT family response regulator
MRAFIIDDERLARSALRRLLKAHEDIEVVGGAGDVMAALQSIRVLNPELIFLDIEIPGGDGFALLAQLNEAPITIFTTAYDSYAVRAFEANALDYLVKPISAERLASSLERARKAFSRLSEPRAGATGGEQRPAALRQIFVREGERCWIVRLTDIFLLASEGNYTRLFFSNERPLILRSLAAIQEKLDPGVFFRANRSQIVNLRAVQSVDEEVGGRIVVTMPRGVQVEISRRQSLRLRGLLAL